MISDESFGLMVKSDRDGTVGYQTRDSQGESVFKLLPRRAERHWILA